jgi:hypothetical protein
MKVRGGNNFRFWFYFGILAVLALGIFLFAVSPLLLSYYGNQVGDVISEINIVSEEDVVDREMWLSGVGWILGIMVLVLIVMLVGRYVHGIIEIRSARKYLKNKV